MDTEIETFLLRGRNPDGGWGYYPGKASRLEPTCWALIALGTDAEDASPLRNWPTSSEGLLLERRNGEPNYAFHGLAMIAMRVLKANHFAGDRVLEALQSVEGIALSESKINRQNNSLQAWSWIPETFSWVEPTAWCLFALKRWRRDGFRVDAERIDVAERMLIDRCHSAGGWNYGNSNMLGQQLKPFVPTTAVALLALQDRRDLPEVKKSVEFLERSSISEKSAVALGLAGIALEAYGRPVTSVNDALSAQLQITVTLANQLAAAMALCFLNKERLRGAFTI